MAFETSLFSYLTSKTAITSLVTKISPNAVAENTAYPYLTYHVLGKDRVYSVSQGPSGKCTIRLAIDIESTNYADTVNVAEAVRNELEGFRGTMGAYTVQRCVIDNETDNPIPPPDDSDKWIYHRAVEWSIDIVEPLPVPT